MKPTRHFLAIAAGLIVSLGVSTVHAQEQYATLKEVLNRMSEEIQSCKDQVAGQDEYIADLEARLNRMTEHAASLQLKLQQADDNRAACIEEKDETHDDGGNWSICNVFVRLFGASRQSTLCKADGRTN